MLPSFVNCYILDYNSCIGAIAISNYLAFTKPANNYESATVAKLSLLTILS